MSIETVCILDLSIPEAVRNALTPAERLQHDIAVQLAGRNMVGGICSLPSPEAVSSFADRHQAAYQALVCQVSDALEAGGIMPAKLKIMLVPRAPELQVDLKPVIATECAA